MKTLCASFHSTVLAWFSSAHPCTAILGCVQLPRHAQLVYFCTLYSKKKKKKSLPLVVVTLHISPQIYFCKNIILCSTSTSFPFPALSCSGAELISALPEVLLALIPRLCCRSGVSPGRGAQQRASAHRSSLPQHRSPRPGSSQLLRCCVWDVGLLADRHASSP